MLSNTVPTLTAVAALAGVLGLVWIAARVVRLAGLAPRPAGNGRLLAVEDVIALDQRRRLSLIRCADRQVLLLTGSGQDVVVGWLGPPSADPPSA
jgi:flagellar protein FliO/FliZ